MRQSNRQWLCILTCFNLSIMLQLISRYDAALSRHCDTVRAIHHLLDRATYQFHDTVSGLASVSYNIVTYHGHYTISCNAISSSHYRHTVSCDASLRATINATILYRVMF